MKAAVLHRFLFCSSLLYLLSVPAAAQMTLPQEHFKEWAALSHQLEATPLDPQVNKDAEMAIQELGAEADFHTPLCNSFFTFFNHLTVSGYAYQAQIYRLYTLGSATYRIETGKTDPYGTNLYAFTSVLKGYTEILKLEPSAREKTLDDLLIVDLSGKLPQHLKKDSTCK